MCARRLSLMEMTEIRTDERSSVQDQKKTDPTPQETPKQLFAYRKVAISFGLLCLLHLALNITLRLYSAAGSTERTELRAQMANQTEELRCIKTQMEAMETRLKAKVAFSATLKTQKPYDYIGPFGEDFILKYENVITNLGSAYNPDTGMFIAPVKGVYFFTFHIFIAWNQSAGAKLMKNSEMVVSATENAPKDDSLDSSSNSVTLLLEPSDKVYLQMHAGRAIYTDGFRRNSFSGHLLYAL